MPEIYHFFQQLVNGLTIGSTYALIAIGYTMVYGIIGMINFAHGEVYMIGSYVAFIALAGLAMMGIHSLPILMTVPSSRRSSSPVPMATVSNGSPTAPCAAATV
jgi:branched-chain amino acid transport system permease protein